MNPNGGKLAVETAWEPRILQFRKRRYSVRLERVFWRFLERVAAGRNVRLGQLTAELAGDNESGNLTSLLRVFCMLEAERTLARTSLPGSEQSLLDVLQECPAPGMIVSRERTVVAHNRALADWLGRDSRPVTGAALTELFQVRTAQPLNDFWRGMMQGTLVRARARLVYLAPGRVSTVEASFLPFLSRKRDFHALVWINVNPPRSLRTVQPMQRMSAQAAAPA